MRFDAFRSQGMKRPQMDVYYTEISWQGVIGPGQLASRAKFCHDKKIRLKDLRLLESNFGSTSVSLQQESIMINTDGFRALINEDSVAILHDPALAYNEHQQFQANNEHQQFYAIKSGEEDLAFSRRREFTFNLLKAISNLREVERSARIEDKSAYAVEYPFELLALGSILDVIFASLEQDLHAMRASNGVLLNTLEKEISSKTMEKLLFSTHQLQNFIERCRNLQKCLDKISVQAKTYFQTRGPPGSPKTLGEPEEEPASSEVHHQDFLTLIDQYSAEEITEELEIMMRELRMKEDNANLVLNSNQLDLVYVGLKLEVLTVGFTLGALLTGTFGMNLKSGAEETEWAFLIAAAVIVTACSAAVVVGWVYVRKIARNF
ncbi:hypothetical protein PCANC_19073 [Puccinia coronata f. sp. avenae]|uniref:Magnesium transporter n=1 Tax=Puccinia coronata f. sp. avenae TaxID=200324 RepID=A0A2N5UB14_9BASI|nr:hypothetical protein PCANC_19073 [Puccinia coronata f. sp. avenae]